MIRMAFSVRESGHSRANWLGRLAALAGANRRRYNMRMIRPLVSLSSLCWAALPTVLLACAQTPQPAQPRDPWTLSDVRPDTSDGLRILIVHDMEGLSGEDDPQQFFFGSPQYPKGQELLVADINAVVDGLYAGGATEVHVVDGHGSGNPEPDVRRDLLDKRAQQVFRDKPFDTYFDLVEPKAYDAVAVVGMHAKTGSRGFASHTLTLGMEVIFNGKTVTETEIVGLSWGRQGIPVIFGSGDDRLARDLETMPWIEFVTVKKALAADSVELRPVDEARAELRAKAERAVRNLREGKTKAMHISTPITAALHVYPPASLALMDSVPGVNYADQAVTFTTDDLHLAYRGIRKLTGVATRAYTGLLMEEVRSRPQGDDIAKAYSRRLEQRWFDVESGRWKAPTATPPAVGTKYHGSR